MKAFSRVLFVAIDAINPTRQPARFFALRRGVLHATSEHRRGGTRKFIDSTRAICSAAHLFENLEQAPALVAITFGVQAAFAFEVHVIDERVASLGRAGNASK